jgi:hypothetical protein
MPYRTAETERLYVCPGCSAPEQAPERGGTVYCTRCGVPFALPDRTALPWNAEAWRVMPDSPQRIQQLRAQDGHPRQVTPTLQAVLGGMSVMPGREQEALAIWQSLRARAQQNDVAASEDLTMLTLMIGYLPKMAAEPKLVEALSESALDAAVLPRHRQEQLGRLVRQAAGHGDRARARRYLGWMVIGAPELETDSDLRVSAAELATLDRDGRHVLALLGARKDDLPIADSLDDLASVLRANAREMLGDAAGAAETLRELSDPQMLALVRSRAPALQLCVQSGQVYGAATTAEAAKRSASSAGGLGLLMGGILGATGLLLLVLGLVEGDYETVFIGGVMLTIGGVVGWRARASAKHAAWLRLHGLALTARVVSAERTGTLINDVPVHQFAIQVAGPAGPYAASFKKLLPEHQVTMLLGQEVRVRANPQRLEEVILEE